jgi:hypothetical protein
MTGRQHGSGGERRAGEHDDRQRPCQQTPTVAAPPPMATPIAPLQYAALCHRGSKR